MIIGILALQGSFREHADLLSDLNCEVRLIRNLDDTKATSACIIPGGESTVMLKQLKLTGLDQWLIESANSGMPIYGTCAGAIVLSALGLLDAKLNRNAYGSQLDSFEANLDISSMTVGDPFKSIFIRAPKIAKVGPKVTVLMKNDSEPVLIEQEKILAGTFHPELTGDTRIHEYFLRSV